MKQTEPPHPPARSKWRPFGKIMERVLTPETGPEHIHLFIHVPAGYNTREGSWGFFRIERMAAEGVHASRSHAVDLYLYPE